MKTFNQFVSDLEDPSNLDITIPILYICGYSGKGVNSSTYKWLEKNFNNELLCIDTKTQSVEESLKQVKEIIRQKNPVIVSNSFGCFISSFFSQPTVWINPCLYPSITLPKIANLTPEDIAEFERLEEQRDDAHEYEDRDSYHPVLSTNDEVVDDYKVKLFSSLKPVMIPGGRHRLTDAQRDMYVKPVIEDVLKDFAERSISITENYHNYIGVEKD